MHPSLVVLTHHLNEVAQLGRIKLVLFLLILFSIVLFIVLLTIVVLVLLRSSGLLLQLFYILLLLGLLLAQLHGFLIRSDFTNFGHVLAHNLLVQEVLLRLSLDFLVRNWHLSNLAIVILLLLNWLLGHESIWILLHVVLVLLLHLLLVKSLVLGILGLHLVLSESDLLLIHFLLLRICCSLASSILLLLLLLKILILCSILVLVDLSLLFLRL